MLRMLLLLFAAALAAKEPVYLLHPIGNDRSEAVAVFDFDKDGLLDVTSGAYWYKAPDWQRQEYREAKPSGEFVSNCAEFATDVNGDGWLDIIAAGWMDDGVFYFENPKKPGAMWPKVQITPSRQTEGMIAVDVDKDGQFDVIPSHWTRQPVWWLNVRGGKIVKRPVGEAGSGHGVGFGDVDGDGKGDILTPNGFYRQVDLKADRWQWTPEFKLGSTGLEIAVYDVNADGRADLIYSQGHEYGIFWLEQGKDAAGKRTWTKHLIDDSFSQVHNLKLVDLNGDGKPEILAGKRYRGHNEKDPGSFEPLAIYYYTFQPGPQPRFTRHTVAYNSVAGAGMNFVVTDLEGDGDLDIVCGGKTGQYWFENLTVNNVPWQKRGLIFNGYPPKL